MNILVFIQANDNQINRMSLEALACAQNLNHSISAITFDEKAAEELSHYKLNEIILVKNSNLNDYNPLHYASTLNKVMTDDFDAIFFAHTYEVRDWVPRLSAKLDYPFISDCIQIKNDNESLSITAPAFLPGHPTPIHDHLTWGVIGVFAGKQITTRYRRCDDGTHSGLADLKVVSEEILTRGAIYPLLPPDDIHSIEAIGDEPGISIHVLGNDLSRQKRHIFHPDIGTVEDWDGGSMMR